MDVAHPSKSSSWIPLSQNTTAEVGLVGVHDSERCFSFRCLQVPPLPRLGRDGEHEEKGDAPAAAAPAEAGAGDAGVPAAWNIFGFGANFLFGFQLHIRKVQLLQAFAFGRAPASSPGTRQGSAKTGGSLSLDGSRYLSSWPGGAPPWKCLAMLAWRGVCSSTPS